MTQKQVPGAVYMPGFGQGAGAATFHQGYYGICLNGDCRFNFFMPGPREVVDLTGIAAGYRVVAECRHRDFLTGQTADLPTIATTNNTDTKIYQLSTTWRLAATITSRVATANGLVSFKNVLAVAFGSGNAYQFATAQTADGLSVTFTASSKTAANASKANSFVVQNNGVLIPQVAYVVSPNELYLTQDLTNTDTTGSTGDQNDFAHVIHLAQDARDKGCMT